MRAPRCCGAPEDPPLQTPAVVLQPSHTLPTLPRQHHLPTTATTARRLPQRGPQRQQPPSEQSSNTSTVQHHAHTHVHRPSSTSTSTSPSPARNGVPFPYHNISKKNYRCWRAGSHALSPRTNRRTRTIRALECTSFIGTITIVVHQQKTTSTTSTATHHNHNDSFPQSHIVGARRCRKTFRRCAHSLSPRLNKTTAPRIPMWSPTMVLTERHSG
jgi:hypothetical protein